MTKKVIILVTLSVSLYLKSFGQCPDKNQLAEKLSYFKSDTSPVNQRINKLQDYLNMVKNCPSRIDSNYVNLLRILFISYWTKNDFFNSAKYLRQAIELIETNSTNPSITRQPLLNWYLFLFSFYDTLGNIPEKMKAVNRCLQIAEETNSLSELAGVYALYAKTEHNFDLGDYNTCIDYSIRCEKYAWICASRNDTGSTVYLNAKKLALGSIGWHIEALLKLKEYEKAEELITSKFLTVKNAGLNEYLAMIYDQSAQVEIFKTDYFRAHRLLELAIKNFENSRDNFNCKQIASNLAFNVYFKIYNDDRGALKYYRKALDYKNTDRRLEQENIMETLRIFNRIANLYVQSHCFDSSNKYFQLAFDQFKKGSDENYILNVSSLYVKGLKKIEYVEELLIDRADAYKKQFEKIVDPRVLKQAIQAYKIADKFLDTIKALITDPKSKLFWRSSAKRLYENAIQACYIQKNPTDAFYFFEKSRAVLLNDQLNEQRWLNQDDILKQSQLTRDIQQLEKRLAVMDNSSAEYAELDKKIFDNRRELENLQDRMKTSNPLYYQSFVDRNVISIQDVRQKILNDHQGLIQLFAGDSAIFVLAITNQNTFLKKINKTVYDSLAERFSRYLASSIMLNKDNAGFTNISHQLYRLIFENIDLPAGRLIISPDGKYFPFEALITNIQTRNYFLYDYAVSYTYSARYLLNNFQSNTMSRRHSFFGIAPVEFSDSLAALTGSDESLKKMKNYFSNSTMLLHHQATKSNFLSQFTDYRIIQLYAHATDNDNGEPTIYFADSALSLSDLFYGKRPVTNLIVLSACETALGKVQSGEGVFSFNRGFAALGIPSAVSNLWKVDNRATYKLTEFFYKYLRNGDPLDVALQKAKKDFIQQASSENQLPFYWAAPILVGQSNKIPIDTSSWLWSIPIALLLILAFWFDRKSFKHFNSQ
jgi:CHAT domain-containing protein